MTLRLQLLRQHCFKLLLVACRNSYFTINEMMWCKITTKKTTTVIHVAVPAFFKQAH